MGVGRDCGGDWAAIVGAKALRDMLGDVYQWTADFYAPYEACAQIDPKGPSTRQCRVVRGGTRSIKARYLTDPSIQPVRSGTGLIQNFLEDSRIPAEFIGLRCVTHSF
jgi:formylglycine-generating enzyme required for sulfatase activity